MAEKYNQQGIDALVNSSRPIPGQSLTNDPDERYPWENPPEFTDFKQALNFITSNLLEEDKMIGSVPQDPEARAAFYDAGKVPFSFPS